MTKYIVIVLACAAISLVNTVIKSKSFGGFVSSAIGGVAGLFAFNLLPVLGTLVHTNAFSVVICAVFGIPGLVSLVFMQMLCQIK